MTSDQRFLRHVRLLGLLRFLYLLIVGFSFGCLAAAILNALTRTTT